MGHPSFNAVYIVAHPNPHGSHDQASTTGHQYIDDSKLAKHKNQIEEDEDIYASIKRLYNEDSGAEGFPASVTPHPKGALSQPQGQLLPSLGSTCSSQMMNDPEETMSSPCPPLQSIEVT